jgi:hypothetical protein
MQRQIDWSRVIQFITQRDAALASSLVGVAAGQIESVQAQLGIVFPSAYVDFLRTMGEQSGSVLPFGDTQVHTFSKLVAQFPPEDYPPKRFFKVAFEASPNPIGVFDTYLDLTRADRLDAPLVRFEIALEGESPEILDEPLSFAETLCYRVFWELDMMRRDFDATLLVEDVAPVDALTTKDAAMSALGERGFTVALPDLVRVACLNREALSVLISISDESELIEFHLSSDTREAIDSGIRDLLAVCPAAVVEEPPARRSESEV